jgi:hypothetical protein
MRPRVNHLFVRRVARGAFAGVWFAALAASAQEPAPGRSIDERWIPSFAFTGGVTFGRQHATVSSDCRAPGSDVPASMTCHPSIAASGTRLREGDSDDELAVTPYVGGNLSLSTPVLARLGRPRLFAGVELPYHFGIDRNVAQKDRPTGIAEPENVEQTEVLDEGAMLGVGSRTRSEVQGLAFGASAGAAFAFEALGRQFRVKPWAGWLRTQIGVRGRVEHGICFRYCDVDGILNGDPPYPTDPNDPNFGFTRVITLKAHDSIWLDGIGPGLDVEMETGRFGPYTLSLFLGGGGYYLIGDRSLAFSAQRTIPPDGPDPVGDPVDYHADFSFRVNPWLYRLGLGLRFSWVGYD